MATPTATVPQFCDVLARSRLLPADAVAALYRRWRAEAAAGDADVDGFRRYLVARQYLTEYQAGRLQRGHDTFLLGGYLILDRLGKGRTAGVYRAVHPPSGQVVALKVLPASKARNPHVLARFQREGRLLTLLDHPNVVRAFHAGQAGNTLFIVMEHVEGETLDVTVARRGRIPPAEAARLAFQTLSGLQHLFERRAVHRDLKPANLMVTPPPAAGRPDTTLAATVKILDIGLVRELFDDRTPPPEGGHLTTEGSVVGTPSYLAPEQARDARTADIRADIYGAGCVLYHLLAGRTPFAERNVMDQVVRHATEPPPPVSRFAPNVPPGLEAAVNRMLEKDPARRPPTPAAAADALRPFLPADAAGAAEAAVLPAYRQWLVSEAMRETPVAVPTPVHLPPPQPYNRPPAAYYPPPPDEVDVELVAVPPLPAYLHPIPPQEPRVVATPPPRPLLDLDRRDWLMLAAGAGGMFTALVGGYVFSKFFAQKALKTAEEEENSGPGS